MSADPRSEVQRTRPYGRIAPRRVLPLPIDSVRPVIRIAHRLSGPLRISDRIIVDYELVVILAGRGELSIGGVNMPYEPHTVLFIPPFIPHSFHSPVQAEGEHIAIHFDFASDIPQQDEELSDRSPYEVRLSSGLDIPRKTALTAGHRIGRSLLDVVRERDSHDPAGSLAAVSHLTEALVLLIRLGGASSTNRASSSPEQAPTGTSPSHRMKISRATQYVEEHLAEPINAQQLAEAANLSISRFNTLFKLETGYAPAEFIRRRRVDEARKLLSEPELSVKEIAARTGFEDSFHFSRVFHKIDGLSPSRYREAVLAGRRER